MDQYNLEFPRCMYRFGGTWALESGNYTVRTVKDGAEMNAAKNDGFHLDQYAAKAAHEAPKKAAADAEDSKPATREELRQKATELGIAFAPQTGNKKLAADIAAKLAE